MAHEHDVAIVGGTGDLGFALGLRLAAAGLAVVLGSRDAERAAGAAAEVQSRVPGARVRGAHNADAAGAAGAVVLAVPFESQARTIGDLREALSAGQVLIDATVPLATAVGGRPTQTVAVWAGSAAQQAQALVPDGVRVVSALHTVAAASLADLDRALDEDVLVCGDRADDKAVVAALLDRIPGLRCVDAGRLEMSRVVEQLTALMISINIRHKAHAGIRIAGLP
ncbi:MAG: 8-hydroxy-5-deazaflavin:NADPH oxidoreductase [Solirubrobacteraceae bacterium]|nr:8-hydroxy-5-deazaflavin:NADPH oxidoreductase [Solirubrobacteraceae bacterium]